MQNNCELFFSEHDIGIDSECLIVGVWHYFYSAMHFCVKRGIEIACRPPVHLSVTLVDQTRTTSVGNLGNLHGHSTTPSHASLLIRSPKAIHLLLGEHGDILGIVIYKISHFTEQRRQKL